MGHVNINRLRTHFNELEAHCSVHRYDLLAVTETFLDSSDSIEPLRLSGMDIYTHNREHKSGGGICLYARSDFAVSVLDKSDPTVHNSPEYVIYRVHSSSFTIIFAIVYRPPETRLPINFLDNLAKFIPLHPHIIVTGDFNINMLANTNNSTLFRRHFSTKSLHLVDSPPTHHTLWSDGTSHHTLLDLFLLKDPDRLIEYRKSPEPFTVGHDFIELDYSLSTPPPPPLRITVRNLKNLNSNTVSSHLKPSLSELHDINAITLPPTDARPVHINLRPGLPNTRVDFFATAISNAIINTFDKLAPHLTFTTSHRNKPWVSSDIRLLQKKRRRLYRIACRSDSS